MENEFVAILNRLINQAKLGTSENKNRISTGSRNRLFQIAKNFSFSFFPPFFFFSSFFPSPRVLLKPCGGPQFSREARTFRLFHVFRYRVYRIGKSFHCGQRPFATIPLVSLGMRCTTISGHYDCGKLASS